MPDKYKGFQHSFLNRSFLICGMVLLAGACNYSTAGRANLDTAAIQATMDAVIPLASTTSPGIEIALPTATPFPVEPSFPQDVPPGTFFTYVTRSGDTLTSLAGRFGIEPELIRSDFPLPEDEYLAARQSLEIPNILNEISPGGMLLSDSELLYSPSAGSFDIQAYLSQTGGYLLDYSEEIEQDLLLSGARIVEMIAQEYSLNPRVLLALIEHRSGWVMSELVEASTIDHPIGFEIPGRSGLYQELVVAATQLNLGFYGWRGGTFLETRFEGQGIVRWNPTLNAGSVALLHLLSLLSGPEAWLDAASGTDGMAIQYEQMFGSAWGDTQVQGTLLSPDLEQPELTLPFEPDDRWSLTAGPHTAWTYGTPRGALDFSPITAEEVCAISARWVTSSADGVVVRARDNAVVIDLDGDGREATGWALVYYHIAGEGMVDEGVHVLAGDRLGHPSCEGGRTTGKHVHFARKYNGEWLPADGPLPMILDGWQAQASERNYYGSLLRGDEEVTSDSSGRQGSTIWK
jgi:LasA protease